MALSDLLGNLRYMRARNVVPALISLVFGVVAWFGVGPLLFGGGEDSVAPAPAPVPAPAVAAVDELVSAVAVVVSEPEPAVEPEPEPLTVLVARRDLRVGTLLRREDVEWRGWREPVDSDAVVVEGETPLRRVLGAVVARRSEAGRPMRRDAFIAPGQRGFLAAVLAPGMRAVTVEADGATTSAKIIFPGDRVDVILVAAGVSAEPGARAESAAQRIVRDVRVLAVGSNVVQVEPAVAESPGILAPDAEGDAVTAVTAVFDGGFGDDRPLGSTFTLEVRPRDAERLSLATSAGQLTLAMRSLTPSATSDARWSAPVLLDEVLAPGAGPRETLRVLRGVESESVSLSGDRPVARGAAPEDA